MKKLNKKGFTLIEVVLVLAIGGLIFLLAFLAFRNASVNRRDTQRRSDAGRFISEGANYSSDASGKAVADDAISVTVFVQTYLDDPWNDPSGLAYSIVL
jgi:prepilin-type N-terminal cleavage/methylation domain-containing protein